ncbi:hypothetical protein DHB74_13320 [Pseudomonas sp. G11-1]|uniref:Tetratricopeptide repeat protein n=1 Tax=Halopseudomonas bauzanensis TaxID=653930 RepID=A0A4V5NKK0_9GAMM|nr:MULTISPECIES: hypothetical protein [Halopseudomonas]MCO5787340.1 hypothetical protein [Pseudomonas sp. G11-1]MCO5790565.1 hypothetical protein [Pseudomonas sp. G11-2]TKA91957.1 hypothetical protein FA869_06035 [Halopseudomonas bauzanensis]WGK62196.1 hypothetical protein QAO71_02880 [Halopseudomonas sp. SMJS2]
MSRLFMLFAALMLSSAAFAMHCPQDMAKIDAILENNPPTDQAVLDQVVALRAQGEELHDAGRHEESVTVLAEALELLDEEPHSH